MRWTASSTWKAIEAAGVPLHHIDFGGGLGIDYDGDTPPAADGSSSRGSTRAASATAGS